MKLSMKQIVRLASELRALATTVEPAVLARYLLAIGSTIGAVASSAKLAPADAKMGGTIRVRYRGGSFWVPLSSMDDLLPRDSRTFSGIREMYARDVHLRHASPNIGAKTVVDVGANRGMFSLLASATMGGFIGCIG
jgi:hypothetical protein